MIDRLKRLFERSNEEQPAPAGCSCGAHPGVGGSAEKQIEHLRTLLARAEARCAHARKAHAALDSRVADLQRDWPPIHAAYFTRAGIAKRLATSRRTQQRM